MYSFEKYTSFLQSNAQYYFVYYKCSAILSSVTFKSSSPLKSGGF